MTTVAPAPFDAAWGRVLVPEDRRNYGTTQDVQELPNLIQIQLDSYLWFLREGLRELLDEISPIADFTGNRMELVFGEYRVGDLRRADVKNLEPDQLADMVNAPFSELECRQRDLTYAAPAAGDRATCGQSERRD